MAEENAVYRARSVEQRATYNHRYYAEHREQTLAYNKAWNKRNRDRCDAATSAWRERNPEKLMLQKLVSRHSAPGREYLTAEKLQARIDFYAGNCRYCGERADTLDHRVPITRGGSHLPANLVPACRSCNSRKRTRAEPEFRARLVAA